jgi:GT2 family glycosyltransferase
MSIAAIIVSHNSLATLPHCLAALSRQTRPADLIHIIDSGSDDCGYLRTLAAVYPITLTFAANIGFAAANNLAARDLPPDTEMVVFLNPDTIVPPDYLAGALAILRARPDVAALSGILEGYDFACVKPTERYDSTGISRAWYGRWQDRDQGRALAEVERPAAFVPALCGALLSCRWQALRPFWPDIFAPEFFLYKEDIELCLRLRRAGWRILFTPELHAFHGRGWQERAAMPRRLRLEAAKSEILLYRRHPSLYIVWALVKYALVRWGKI